MPDMNPKQIKDRSVFLSHLENLINKLYELPPSQHGVSKDWIVMESRVRGFAEAGLLLNLVSEDEIQSSIDLIHQQVFGRTRPERAAHDQRVSQMLDS